MKKISFVKCITKIQFSDLIKKKESFMKKIILLTITTLTIAGAVAFVSWPSKAKCSSCKPFPCKWSYQCDGMCQCEKNHLGDEYGICL